LSDAHQEPALLQVTLSEALLQADYLVFSLQALHVSGAISLKNKLPHY
jgi:hypothetical protein